MKIKYQPPLAFLLAFLMSLSLLSGCVWQQAAQEEDNATTLWVVTEESSSDGMNLQAEIIAQRMEERNENLTVKLDILPTKEQEREIYLKQLRTQIMAGNGPDVYLLPTGDTLLLDYPAENTKLVVEPLFADIYQTMLNGIFADIQEYYDADQSLDKDALKTEVMDTGLLNGARYALPLRFDLPLILTTSDGLKDSGLSREIIDTGVSALVETVLMQEDRSLAAYGIQMPTDLRLLPPAFDYQKGEVLLSVQEIAEYMHLYQAWKAAAVKLSQPILAQWGDIIRKDWITGNSELYEAYQDSIDGTANRIDIRFFNSLKAYIWYEADWLKANFPLYSENTGSMLDAAATAKATEQEIIMLPFRGTNSVLTANVTYYGAVGNNSKHPELAYDFLRQFLSEEFQWECYRPRVNKDVPAYALPEDPQADGLVEESWPVRTVGSVTNLWDNRQYQVQEIGGTRGFGSDIARKRIIQSLTLTDADLPALSWPIDEVRFPIVLDPEESFEHALSLLNDENGNPTDVDIDALAEQVHLSLWWHLAEG